MSGIIDFRCSGMSADDVADCNTVFAEPTKHKKSNGHVYVANGPIFTDPEIKKVHDKVQAEVSKNLRIDQYRLQTGKMILTRAKKFKAEAADLVGEVLDYKNKLIAKNIYSNIDINNLVDAKYDELYKALNIKLDLEFPCNVEAKK